MKNDVQENLTSGENSVNESEFDFSKEEFENQSNVHYDNAINRMKDFVKEHESHSDNYFLGFIGSFVGALIGAIPWGIVGSMGYFVGWLGFLIVFLSSKGYDICKVKTNKIKVICIIISSIIAVFAGQVICDIIILKTDPDFSAHFSEYYTYYMSNLGSMIRANAANLVIGIVFVCLGGFSVIKEISQTNKQIEEYKKAIETNKNNP